MDIKKFLERYNHNYKFLYENENVCGYDEALEWFDANMHNPKIEPIIESYIKNVKDYISSDREAVAFAFTCEDLGLIN